MVSEGMWCSEAALWTQWVHQGSMQSAEAADVVALHADKFREEMCQQKQNAEFALHYGTRFIESLNTCQRLDKGDECEPDEFEPDELEPDLEDESHIGQILSDLHTPPDIPQEAQFS